MDRNLNVEEYSNNDVCEFLKLLKYKRNNERSKT